MIQLWAWKYKGQDEVGIVVNRYCASGKREFRWLNGAITRWEDSITNLRKVKVVDEDAATKTYLTTEQFIKVWKSLDEPKRKELSAARSAAWDVTWSAAQDLAWSVGRSAAWDVVWYAANSAARDVVWYAANSAARDADLAVIAKDEITAEQFEILTSPWTSCGLSLYAEDWEEVLNPKVVEPKNFGAIVEAETAYSNRRKFVKLVGIAGSTWFGEKQESYFVWSDLINPTIISEGVE